MDLLPFCALTASTHRPEFAASTPAGRRVIVSITEARLVGDDFVAFQVGTAAADWLLTWPDGTAMPDVWMTIATADGARLFAQYHGRADWTAGPGSNDVFIAMTFETADERYLWMNKSMFVGRGGLSDDGVRYTIYRLA